MFLPYKRLTLKALDWCRLSNGPGHWKTKPMDSHGDWKAKGPLLELGSHAAVAGVGKESDC